MGCKCSKGVETLGPSDTIASDLVQHFFVQDINDYFTFHEVLGKGAFGYVCRATNKSTGKVWAVKIVELINEVDKNALRNEIGMLKRLQHPNIVRVTCSYEDTEKMYMVMQLCTGRELFDHLYKDKRIFTEEEVREFIRHLLRAVSYMHANQITHRDMKLENLLLENESDSANLKVCDFGFSKFIKKGQRLTKTLGTIDYVAPEVLVGNYTEKCDVWSIGIITYELLSGISPFRGQTNDETMANILDAKLDFQLKDDRKPLSAACINFIRSLVQEEPDDRCSATEALELPWMEHRTNRLNTVEKQQVIRNLTYFGKSKKIKQTAMLTVALGIDETLMQPTVSRTAFHFIDRDKTGTIDIDEFCKALSELGFDEDEAQRLFACVDQTQSKTINYLEFLAATMNQKNVEEIALKEAFTKLDAHKSGRISVNGLLALLQRTFDKEQVEEMINSADITGDGCLNYDEFKAMFADTPSSEHQVLIKLDSTTT